MDGILVLSNGLTFEGTLRAARKATSGEIIFNTAMTGYQEILTDPSYCGQIVTMTYPNIGNYGVNPEDVESRAPFAAGMIVKELSRVASNWRATESLEDYLTRHEVTLLEGVDTRALVIALREQGTVPGLIVPAEGADLEALRAQAAALPGMEGQNLAKAVSVEAPYRWDEGHPGGGGPVPRSPATGGLGRGDSSRPFRVVAYDYGIKYNILRSLAGLNAEVEVVPYNYPAEQALALGPDGVFLSNGPGDPAPVGEAVEIVQGLLGKVPIFGICLGHQIMTLALGGSTYKLKFGHHGANHPVMNLATEKVEVTSQNHGFAVREETLPDTVRITHRSLNDRTVEGLESLVYPAFSVQYHPEASPGPHDSGYLFSRFFAMMEARRKDSA
ncbi:MAG: glutamine-hydrolyzing carbamoyl-phosphate synthase small subunit [SAR324 cluster bacterium]|nr:glutamine-hydrolyzing carbamoyl-phosphate synthase small subunit [SAR324 cluster bacterium]